MAMQTKESIMNNELEIGKLSNEELNRLILNEIQTRRSEVKIGASVGEDTAVLDVEGDYIILSSDPITGAVSNIGKLGVHVSVNDISTKGADAVGILITLLLPPHSNKNVITTIMDEVNEECERLNMDLIGGHTEVTDAVTKPLIVTTVIGRVPKNKIPKKDIIEPGFFVCMTKYAGLEGTAILAQDQEESLQKALDKELIEEGKNLVNLLSVSEEGKMAISYRIGYMHDVTEGGIEGAIWEASEAIGYGVEIERESIPVLPSTKAIAEHFQIDLYKLISSGSMLIVIHPEDYKELKTELEKKEIPFAKIGVVTSTNEKIITNFDGIKKTIEPPKADALYSVDSLQ